jgi:hypothetical protein
LLARSRATPLYFRCLFHTRARMLNRSNESRPLRVPNVLYGWGCSAARGIRGAMFDRIHCTARLEVRYDPRMRRAVPR